MLRVFAFKDGLLSAVGHDLVLEPERVDLQIEGDRVTATIDASSLRVVEGPTSAKDRAEIEANARKVLGADRYPTIVFTGTYDGSEVRGDLALHGTSRAIRFPLTRRADHLEGSVTIHQPDFGIAPFRAAMGALKIKPDVRVEIRYSAGNASV